MRIGSRARTRSCRVPPGGIVGAVEVSRLAGFDRIIGFDMGGTSTDVTHYAGRIRARVRHRGRGRAAARADDAASTPWRPAADRSARSTARASASDPNRRAPIPVRPSYRRGGPLDRHRLQRDGRQARSGPLPARVRPDRRRSRSMRTSCARSSRRSPTTSHARPARARTPEEVADGFLKIAVENMANAIKHISVQRGYDVTEYTLCCFGGAGGQHACLVADALGMTRVFIHPLAGVLSAYGMGLADVRALRQQAVEARADPATTLDSHRRTRSRALEAAARAEVARAGHRERRASRAKRTLHVKYDGTDTDARDVARHDDRCAPIVGRIRAQLPRSSYGFLMPGKAAGRSRRSPSRRSAATQSARIAGARVRAARGAAGADQDAIASTPAARCTTRRSTTAMQLRPGDAIDGPAIDARATTRRPSSSRAGARRCTPRDDLVLERVRGRAARARDRHDGRPGPARGLQQPVHGDRRADGRDARQHRVLGQHQGAARLLLRAVRRATAT